MPDVPVDQDGALLDDVVCADHDWACDGENGSFGMNNGPYGVYPEYAEYASGTRTHLHLS